MARKRNSIRRRKNGMSYPAPTTKEKRQVEFFLIALGGGLGGVAGATIGKGGKGAAIGGAIGILGAMAIIYTQD